MPYSEIKQPPASPTSLSFPASLLLVLSALLVVPWPEQSQATRFLSLCLSPFFFNYKLFLVDSFRFIEFLQRCYREFSYTPHPVSPIAAILH